MKKFIAIIAIIVVSFSSVTFNLSASETPSVSRYMASNQNYTYMRNFYENYDIDDSVTDALIVNMKNGKLPESVLLRESPVDTQYSSTKTSTGEDEQYIDTFSDGSILVRSISSYNCVNGSGFSACDAKYTIANSSLTVVSYASYEKLVGKDNDVIQKAWGGSVASQVYGLKVGDATASVCRKTETSSKPASTDVKFTTTISGLSNTNHARLRLDDSSLSTYHHMFGDTGSLASC